MSEKEVEKDARTRVNRKSWKAYCQRWGPHLTPRQAHAVRTKLRKALAMLTPEQRKTLDGKPKGKAAGQKAPQPTPH